MAVVSIDAFADSLKLYTEHLREASRGGKKILGYFCTYTPVEMLHAAGFLPVRIMGSAHPVSDADNLVPNFVCPYMRSALEKAITGQYDYLTGIVDGYTCDVACGFVKIWELHVPGEIFHTVPLPYGDTPEARTFFRAEMDELTRRLTDAGGRFSEDALDESLQLYNELRGKVLDLYRLRYEDRLPLCAEEFSTVIQAGFVTPPEQYLSMLTELTSQMERVEALRLDGIRVLVSGSLIENPRILHIVEEAGGRIVADDLCTGLRAFAPREGEGGTPLDRLVDRYVNRFPCPARSRARERGPLLIELMERSKARAVLFLFQKFCTPHLADHPMLVEDLKNAGIPSIAIELDETSIQEGQIRTRIQAFLEMLG